MAIASISFSFTPAASRFAAAAPTAAVEPADSPTPTHDESKGWVGARRHALYDAMMSALQTMGLGAAAPASPALPDAAAAPGGDAAATEPAPAAPTEPVSVEDAVRNFAGALWQALGAESASGPEREPRGNGQRVGHARHHLDHHHHHHHGRGEQRSYAGLAQRLESLAASLGSTAPAAELPASEPVGGATPVLPITSSAPTTPTTPTPTTEASTLPSTDTAAPSLSTPLPVADGSTAAHVPASPNPLADAFAGLLSALQSKFTVPPSTGDTGSQLASFLRSLSQALAPAGASGTSFRIGLLIDVNA